MKKLMIAAAAAAMIGGANAELCYDDVTTTQSGCALYNVKFTLKSLDTKLLINKGTKASSTCYDDSTSTICCTYFDNATYTFDGIIWDCAAGCTTLSGKAANFVLWNTKKKMAVTTDGLIKSKTQKDNKDVYQFSSKGVAGFDFINRYSKAGTKVQAFWTVDAGEEGLIGDLGTIYAAGFGTFDAKKLIVKSISGNAVAAFEVPTIPSYKDDKDGWTSLTTIFSKQKCVNPNPDVLDLCATLTNWCAVMEKDGVTPAADVDKVAASGTWSVKYNASLSAGKKSLAKIVPDYAQTVQ